MKSARAGTPNSAPTRRLAIDELDGVAQPTKPLGLHGFGSEIGPKPLQNVNHDPEENTYIREKELRLVVVANKRETALENLALVGVGDLGREVVALDSVGVVQIVQSVVERQAEAGPPGDHPFLDLGRDPNLSRLLEDLRRNSQQADEGGSGPGAKHHLQ